MDAKAFYMRHHRACGHSHPLWISAETCCRNKISVYVSCLLELVYGCIKGDSYCGINTA